MGSYWVSLTTAEKRRYIRFWKTRRDEHRDRWKSWEIKRSPLGGVLTANLQGFPNVSQGGTPLTAAEKWRVEYDAYYRRRMLWRQWSEKSTRLLARRMGYRVHFMGG